MPEEIKGLIEKIKQEGIQAAEAKAREIASLTNAKADVILKEAKGEAEKIIAGAKEEAKKTQDATEAMLTQAARDMLLTLRLTIEEMLNKLIAAKVHETLTLEELTKIILACVKEHGAHSKEDILIFLSRSDAKKLDGLLNELKEQVKQKILLKPSDEIQAGFIISFDAGKSQFDFSTKSLAEYIGSYLKPKLSELLRQASHE